MVEPVPRLTSSVVLMKREYALTPAKIVRDVKSYREWSVAHDRCQVCQRNQEDVRCDGEFPYLLQTHHLIGGAGRSDEPCNLLRLCPRCHEVYHGFRHRRNGGYWPPITMGVMLMAKKLGDPDEWNPDRLEHLRHRAIPELEPIPQEYDDPDVQ